MPKTQRKPMGLRPPASTNPFNSLRREWRNPAGLLNPVRIDMLASKILNLICTTRNLTSRTEVYYGSETEFFGWICDRNAF
jgi:hypothetical protein